MLIYARSSVKETGHSMPRRHTRRSAVRLALSALLATALGAGAAPSIATEGERIFRHVLALAGGIGPRKTGTDADRRAIDYVRAEMESAGLRVELQEVRALADPDGERAVGSWNVIGRLDGDSPDALLMAAHHDSRHAAVPGANDDASGLAVLLEVARRTAVRPRRTSYLFISFCGEEEGLLGSTYYARNADLSHVRAVIALEMVGRGELIVAPVPRPAPSWAEEALLRAARETGARGIGQRPIYDLVPRLVELPFTSDHETFLERGIPAFLLAGTFPAWTYHTQEDSVLRIRMEPLARAAGIVDRLLQDLEASPPPREGETRHLPLMAFGQGVVVPEAVLRGLEASALLAVALLALARLRSISGARALGETFRVLIVAAAATALGISGAVASESLMERMHGTRFPWMAHQPLHLFVAALLMAVTGWLGLKLFRRIKPTVEPGPYLAAALLLPALAVAACLRRDWPEPGAVAAIVVLSFLASLFVQSIGRKLAIGLLGLLPLTLFMTPGDYRVAVDLAGAEIPAWGLFTALFVVSFPFVLFLAHVASFQDCLHSPVWWWVSGPWVGATAFLLWLGALVPAALLPAYDLGHRQVVRLRQSVDLTDRKATLMVHSADSLDGVRLRGIDRQELRGPESDGRIELPFPADRVAFEAGVERDAEGPADAVICRTQLKVPRPTDRLSYRFTSRSGFRVPGRGEETRHSYTYTEVAPQADPSRTFRLLLPEGGDLELQLRADFAEDLLGVDPSGGPRTFVHQGVVVAFRRLLEAAGAGAPPPASPPRSPMPGSPAR